MYSKRKIYKTSHIVFAALMSILFIIGCTVTDMTLTEENNGDSINLKLNEEILIRLESNPTTGYSWFLKEVSGTDVVSD